jgi:hypothetical protein
MSKFCEAGLRSFTLVSRVVVLGYVHKYITRKLLENTSA